MEVKRVAMVTGAAGTMGRAVSEGLLQDGYRVVLADIAEDRLRELAKELSGETRVAAFDIGDWDQASEAVAVVQREFGDIDVLVNNAGILSNNKLQATTPEEWHRVMRVNLDGAFYLSRLVVPRMKEKGWGRIINTSSYAAKSGGVTAGTAYSVSKGALIALTFSIAAETLGTGITVNAIAPAYVKTPMVTEQLTEEQRQAVIQKIPMKRFCEPEEFAHVVRFLASPLSGFISGEVIDQNGGMMFD